MLPAHPVSSVSSPSKKQRTHPPLHSHAAAAAAGVKREEAPPTAAAASVGHALASAPAPASPSPLRPLSAAAPHSRKRRAADETIGDASAAAASTKSEPATEQIEDDDGEYEHAEEEEGPDGDDAFHSHAATGRRPATHALDHFTPLDPAAVAAVSLPYTVHRSEFITPIDYDWFFEKDAATAATAAASHASDEGAAATPPLSTFLTAAQTALGLRSLAEVPELMTRAQWNALRRAIGRTRRLSAACLREEACDLQKQREEWRQLQATSAPVLPSPAASDHRPALAPTPHMPVYPSASWLSMENTQQRSSAPVEAAAAFPVASGPPSFAPPEQRSAFSPRILVEGTPVLVRHPCVPDSFAYATILSHEFHRASASSVHRSDSEYRPAVSVEYRVGFEGQAGAQPWSVEDIDVFYVPPQLRAEAAESSQRFMEERTKLFPFGAPHPSASSASVAHDPLPASFSSPSGAVSSDDDVTLVCHLLQLVDRKRILLDQLHEMNDTMQILRQTSIDDVITNASTNDAEEGMVATAAPVAAPAPAAAASLSQPLPLPHPPPSSMDVDNSDMPSLESTATPTATVSAAPASASSSAHASPLASAKNAATVPPAAPSLPSTSVSASEFRLSFDLFRRQYAWLVLQLESTSSSLDATHTQLRVRRATRRRSSMYAADGGSFSPYADPFTSHSYSSPLRGSGPGSFVLHSRDYGNESVAAALALDDDGSVDSLVSEAADDFVAPMLGELRPPLPLRGRGALLGHKGSAVHTLVSRAIATVLLIERGFAGADLQWLEINGERLLHAFAPKHPEHRALHMQVADAMHQLQYFMRASKMGARA